MPVVVWGMGCPAGLSLGWGSDGNGALGIWGTGRRGMWHATTVRHGDRGGTRPEEEDVTDT